MGKKYFYGEPIRPPKKIRIPKGKVKSPRRDRTNKAKREKDKKSVVRGKEVSVVEPASEAQIIYGTMRVGGVVTFKDTNQDSKAYLVTGTTEDENELVWTAKTAGTPGNDLSIKIVIPPGNVSSASYSVVGNVITVTTKASGGAPASDMNNIIARLADFPAAAALVRCRKVDSNKNGTVKAFTETNMQYGGGNWQHAIHTLACHEINAVTKLFINNIEVTFGASPDPRWGTGRWSNKVFMDYEIGTDDQLANGDLVNQLPTVWTTEHRQRGHAYAYLITVYDKNLFAEGDPEISFLVEGKPCYDPRTGTTYYTRNSALIAADFLMNPHFGFRIPSAKIDMAALSTAADICDEDVSLAAGGTEKRYRCDGVADTSQSPDEILSQILMTMDGDVVNTGGIYKIFAAAYRTPVMTLTEEHLRGTLKIRTRLNRRETFNCVRGTYVSPAADYNETDFPLIRNSTYITEDGEERVADLALNFVLSPGQAQRLGKIALERTRQGMTTDFPATLAVLDLIPNDTVYVYLPDKGFNNKVFEVEQMHFVEESDGYLGIDLALREIASGVFDWNSGEETTVDLAPNTTLPSATDVEEPTGLTLTSGTAELDKRSDGIIWTRLKVAWTESATQFVTSGGGYRIQFRVSNPANAWSQAIDIPGGQNFYHIVDVIDGFTYDIRILAYNSIGYQSEWVEATHTVQGKSERPTAVDELVVVTTDYGISFSWAAIPDVDADEYEIRVGATWETSIYVWRGRGTSARWENKTAANYNFLIKAIDTTGNEQETATSAELEIDPPGQPIVTSQFSGPNVLLSWNLPTEGSFKIYDYLISFGPNYDTSTAIAVVSALDFTQRGDFSGTRSFWVAARDIAGNIGTPGVITVTVNPPSAVVALAGQSADAVIQLDWTDPIAGTFPVVSYNIYKGATYDEAQKIGNKAGTFFTYIERFGGTFYYHIEAVDSAGNVGAHATASVTIMPPRSFYIKAENNLLANEAVLLTNAVEVPRQPEKLVNDIFFPIDTTVPVASVPILSNPQMEPGKQTFGDWWDNNGWSNLTQAINQGFDVPFLAPTSTRPGQIKWRVDYEVVFSKSFINFQYEIANIGDAVNVVPSVNISEDGITFTPFEGYTQVFAENFQYVEYVLDFQATSNIAFAKVLTANAVISLKRETEFLLVDCVADNHATGGTPFTFESDFLDVEDIQATPWGDETEPGVAQPNFIDVPNPTGGKALLWDIDGTPKNGKVRVQVTGAINP